MLKLRYTPRLPRNNLLMARTDQQQIRHHRNAKGLLDPSLFPTDLVLAQPEVCLQLAIDLFYRPPSLVRTYHLSRDPLVQIGHQDFRLLRAQVSPSFTQHHSDVADVPQTQACAIHPEGFAAFRSREAGHPDALIILARQMGHQVFDCLILDRFPGPGHGEHKAPPTRRIVGVALHHHLDVVLRAIGRVAHDHDALGPGWRDKASDHLPKQGILRLIGGMAFRSDQTKGDWEAIAIPVDDQQGKADPEKPRVMFTLTAFLGQRVLRAPFGLLTAVTPEIEGAITGGWQGRE